MRPADHPEFFRLPAPLGTSRESSIVLDVHGEFWHEGVKITRADMRQAFARWLGRHPDDGRYILQNGYDWVYLRVEDAPYFVLGVRGSGEGLDLTLSDGSVEKLTRGSLFANDAGVVYARIKGGSEMARFTPSAQRALEPHLIEFEGRAALEWLDGPEIVPDHPR